MWVSIKNIFASHIKSMWKWIKKLCTARKWSSGEIWWVSFLIRMRVTFKLWEEARVCGEKSNDFQWFSIANYAMKGKLTHSTRVNSLADQTQRRGWKKDAQAHQNVSIIYMHHMAHVEHSTNIDFWIRWCERQGNEGYWRVCLHTCFGLWSCDITFNCFKCSITKNHTKFHVIFYFLERIPGM